MHNHLTPPDESPKGNQMKIYASSTINHIGFQAHKKCVHICLFVYLFLVLIFIFVNLSEYVFVHERFCSSDLGIADHNRLFLLSLVH